MTYTILGRTFCTFCTKAIELLDEHGIEHEYINIYEMPFLITLLKGNGLTTVPQIYDTNGLHIGGYTELEAQLND